MRFFDKIIGVLFRRIVPSERRKAFLSTIINELGENPLAVAYESMGILKFEDSRRSGEYYLINSILPKILSKSVELPLVFLDIGANTGQYSLELNQSFPSAMIYSFEPNPHAFTKLKNATKNISMINPLNIGFDITKRISKLNTYKNAIDSSHSTMYENVLTDIHKRTDTISIEIRLERVDDFVKDNGIDRINFMKIDTEGNELNIFKSAESLLHRDVIDVIQFEFNEMNVISKVFFKDFYDLLSGKYALYRLDTERLIPIKSYNSNLEIFKFQNILAVSLRLDERLRVCR